MNIQGQINAFVQARRANGRAQRTLKDYRRVLDPFATWCKEQNITLEALDRDTVRHYVATLRDTDWSDGTVSIYVRVLRTFLRWLHTEKRTSENLAQAIEHPESSERVEDLPTNEELLKLLEVCQGDKLAARDRALVLTFLDTGLRLGELVQLRSEALHLDEDGQTMWMLIYAPKTNTFRFVFGGFEAMVAMQAYLAERSDTWPQLWVGVRGPLTTLGIYRALRRRVERAGINPARVHPHAFRKMFATRWTENGGDTVRLKRVGGWATTSTVERYVRLAERNHLATAHRQFSPADRLLRR